MKREREIFSFSLVASTLAAMAVFAVTKDKSWTDILQPYAMTIVLLLVMGSILGTEKFKDIFSKKQLIPGSVSYLFSVLAVSLLPENYILNWWMAGAVFVSLYIHLYLGIALQGILTYLLCGLYGYSVENFIFYCVIGIILCILTRYMTTLASFVYVLIIAVTSNLTLIFVMNNFAWKLAASENSFYSLLSTGVVVTAAYVLHRKEKEEPKTEKEPAAKDTEADDELNDRLDEILAEAFPLRQRLLEHSQKLYGHSLHISSIAQEAALCVGCNDKIVQAGGLYHEIGRIAGKDYIEEGVKLGEEYHLPQPVIDIICQHNSKYEKPQSVEAAVVMITDSIVSTIEYMEQEQKEKKVHLSAEKIIEQIFDIRLSKGTLDESGMDICNYKKLKEFFKKEYSKGENV